VSVAPVVDSVSWSKHSPTEPACQVKNARKKTLDFYFWVWYHIGMKTRNNKYTQTALAALCGVHFDTIHRARKNKRCSHNLATLLYKITGIPRSEWLDPASAKTNPWERVLK
jgi:hypothetical protein